MKKASIVMLHQSSRFSGISLGIVGTTRMRIRTGVVMDGGTRGSRSSCPSSVKSREGQNSLLEAGLEVSSLAGTFTHPN